VQIDSISINSKKIMHMYSFCHVYHKKHVHLSCSFESIEMEITDWSSKRSRGKLSASRTSSFQPGEDDVV
jgi:hypothetical protein